MEGAREKKDKNTIESRSATLAERKNRVVTAREKREKRGRKRAEEGALVNLRYISWDSYYSFAERR